MSEPSTPATPTNQAVQPRKPWVEPTLEQLDLSETAMNPGTGYDGGTFADCTKS